MRFLVRGSGGVVFDVCAVFGGVEVLDAWGGFGELDQGDLSQNYIATEGGDDCIVACSCQLNALCVTGLHSGCGTFVSFLDILFRVHITDVDVNTLLFPAVNLIGLVLRCFR